MWRHRRLISVMMPKIGSASACSRLAAPLPFLKRLRATAMASDWPT